MRRPAPVSFWLFAAIYAAALVALRRLERIRRRLRAAAVALDDAETNAPRFSQYPLEDAARRRGAWLEGFHAARRIVRRELAQ